ncbi:MAG: hypothetical protein AB1571_04375 [Nanoarchaeota archaeon]
MPEGRMLKKAISTSKKLAELKTDSARLLYTWLIPHLDVEGRFYGDEDVIKGSIVPRLKSFTPEKIKNYLQDMANIGLIIWYEVDGDKYLQFTVFEKHQTLNRDREGKSQIPPSTPENSGVTPENSGVTPENSGVTPENSLLSKDKLSKDNINLNKDNNKVTPELFQSNSGVSKKEKLDINKFPFLKEEDFRKTYEDYLDMRKKKKKPATIKAEELVLKTLHKYSKEKAMQMLEQSIRNSWTDVYEIKGGTNGKYTGLAEKNYQEGAW